MSDIGSGSVNWYRNELVATKKKLKEKNDEIEELKLAFKSQGGCIKSAMGLLSELQAEKILNSKLLSTISKCQNEAMNYDEDLEGYQIVNIIENELGKLL